MQLWGVRALCRGVPVLPRHVACPHSFAHCHQDSEPLRCSGGCAPSALPRSLTSSSSTTTTTASLLCRRGLSATAALVCFTSATTVHTPSRAFTTHKMEAEAASPPSRGARRGPASRRGSAARARRKRTTDGRSSPPHTAGGASPRHKHHRPRPRHRGARGQEAGPRNTNEGFAELEEEAGRDQAGETAATGASARSMEESAPHAGDAADPASVVPPLRGDEVGWGLETVDGRTGRTALEDLYDRHLERIRAVLEQPLPPLPQDGSIEPDFFVGFASYSYQLRDQYRAVVARELQVPVAAVRLSVAWSGRFDVRRFGRVQKVCGVCIDRQRCLSADEEAAPGGGTASSSSTSTSSLSAELLRRIEALVAAINSRTRDDLLQMQLFQASPPLPEVEFALIRRAHRTLFHLHAWIRRYVLQRAVVVVVYGLPPPRAVGMAASRTAEAPPPRGQEERTSSTSGTGSGWSATSTANDAGDARVDAKYAAWQERCGTRCAEQLRVINDQWLRLFHRRQVVPLVLSLTELATRLAVAVVRGEVPFVTLREGDDARPRGASDEHADLLDEDLKELLTSMAGSATASVSGVGPVDGAATSAGATDVLLPTPESHRDATTAAAAPLFYPASTTQQEAAMRWVRLVYEALLLREAQGVVGHEAALSTHHDATSNTTAVVAPSALPALFAQGVYAGGREEVAYLQHNRMAMDALLLHPHEISFKKKFMSRMRHGHRRLRMEEESAAPYSMKG